ncbi:MAG: hypothetical protein ABI543_03185 [Ignavibacteria bacterium]
MRTLLLSVILPVFLIITGIVLLLLDVDYGIYISVVGGIWLVIAFLIDYKEDEEQPLGMGRGRQR